MSKQLIDLPDSVKAIYNRMDSNQQWAIRTFLRSFPKVAEKNPTIDTLKVADLLNLYESQPVYRIVNASTGQYLFHIRSAVNLVDGEVFSYKGYMYIIKYEGIVDVNECTIVSSPTEPKKEKALYVDLLNEVIETENPLI